MDAKQMGTFIALRRKELGLTQARLAAQLHVTGKAISRWERGIGLPYISNIEALAAALDVGLIELMQTQRNEEDHMSTQEAEQLLIDTIQLSKNSNRFAKWCGTIVLSVFAIVSVYVLYLLSFDWKAVLFPSGILLAGLIAWGIPVWQMTLARASATVSSVISSFGFALLSLLIQFISIANEVHTGDLAAVEDTIDGLVLVVIAFIAVTLLLNGIAAKVSRGRRPL